MRLLPLKVQLQITFAVEDDNGNLSELVADPIILTAKQWQEFRAFGYEQACDALAQQVLKSETPNPVPADA